MPSESGKSKSGRRDLVRAVALQLCLVLVTLVGVEFVLRVAGYRDARLEPVDRRLPYQHDPEIGWVPVPNKVTITGVTINSIGLRDVEPATTGGPTIMFVGNSFVYGPGLPREDRFTERLREQLPGFRIVNAGVSGYGTDQEYMLLKRLWPKVVPDVVVLIVCVENDHDDNSSNVRYSQLKPYLVNVDGEWQFRGQPVPRYYSWYYYNNWLAERSVVARIVVKSYMRLRYWRIKVPDPTAQLVGMMRDYVESQGARFLVGLQLPDKQLEPHLVAWNIPYVRLDGAERINDQDSHWSPQGHRTVAKRLMSFLAAEKVLGTTARESRE